jgi:hypothetical protein
MRIKPKLHEVKRAAVLITTPLTVAICVLLTRGYQSGVGDHNVLSALGISWTDKSAFLNDYFVANSTQPHWAFDYYSAFFESHFGLSFGYALYWIISIVVIGHSLFLVASATRTSHPLVVSSLAGIFLSLGPVSILGTTTPALGIAIPHVLGLSLALLTLGQILNERYNSAGVAALAASITHVQHGVISIGFLGVAVAVSLLTNGKVSISRYIWIASSIFAVIFDLKIRPIIAGSKDFVYVCAVMIPYHCDVNSWKQERFVLGAACAALTLVVSFCAFEVRKNRLLMVIGFTGIITLSIISILTARIGIHNVSDILQSLNVYRINSVFIPLAALALAFVMVQIKTVELLATTISLIAGWFYFSANYDNSLLKEHAPYIVVSLLMFFVAHLLQRFSFAVMPATGNSISAFAIAVLLICALLTSKAHPAKIHYLYGSTYATAAEQIKSSVPPGQTITMDPKLGWVRLLSRRAVVVDCKYKPYGGASLQEYVSRLAPLGGYKKACQKNGFEEISASTLIAYATKYQSHYILLKISDPRTKELLADSWAKLQTVEKYVLLKK